MLNIINNLSPFFEDCYRRINVREYAKLIKVSPPTASKMLGEYYKEGLLKKQEERNYIFFFANPENSLFVDLSRIYWKIKLKEIVKEIEEKTVNPIIILFGSLSKAETMPNSDIDLAIIADKKDIDINLFEDKLKREIQLLWFEDLSKINKELKNNILNGYILSGRIKL